MHPTAAPTGSRRRRAARLLLIAAAAVAAGACTRGATVESAWVEGVPRGAAFRKVLIVGVTPAYNTRCRFERMMMDSLNGAEVRAVTSCSVMGSKDPLSRDTIVGAVRATGADAVLSTRLVDARGAMVEGGSSEARGAAYYKPIGYGYDSYYGAFGVPVTYLDFVPEQSALTLQRTVVVSSNLYDAATAAQVYSLDTTVHDKSSQGEVIDAVAVAISGRLRRDGLVAK